MRFEAVLRNAGYTEQRFLSEQRRIALRQQLLGTLTGDPVVPKTALDAFNRFQNEERSIDYVQLGPAQAGDIPAPTPEVLGKYFEERKVLFRAPEYRKITVVAADPAGYRVPDRGVRRRSQESLCGPPHALRDAGAPPSQADRVPERRRGQGRSRQARPGHHLRGAGRRARPQGHRHRSRHRREIGRGRSRRRRCRLRAQVGRGQRAGQGRFGIAIVKVESSRPGKTRPFEEVAADLKRDIQAERARNEVTNVQEKVEDERLGGASLADAAKKFNLAARTIEAIDRDGKDPQGNPVPDLPQNVDVLSAAFGAEVHGENEPLRLPSNGGYVWYDVDAITPARDLPLAEVKDKVVARWRDDEIATRLKTKATEMLDKIKAGTALAEVAAADNLKVETRPGIKRASPAARHFGRRNRRGSSRRRRIPPAASRARTRRNGSCFASRRSRCRRSIRNRRTPSGSMTRCGRAPPRT